MRFVVGRHGSSADIQVPPDFSYVSRSHARVSQRPGGRYLLEDLNSSNGTFVLANGMWEQVTRADVDASTPILLADYQTCVAELLRSLPRRTQQPAAPMPMAAPALAAQPLQRSEAGQSDQSGQSGHAGQPGPGGPAAAAPAAGPGEFAGDGLPVEMLLKMVGLGDLMRVLTTLHTPLRGIRELVADDRKALYQALLAFAAFLTLVPFLHKEVILRLGSLVSYPVMAQGQAVENGTVVHIVAIISGVVGFMVMYALPKSLYAPSARNLVVASNIYANMYCAFYISAADLVKLALWVVTGSLALPMVFGLLVLVGTIGLQLYIWRVVLGLRWKPMLLFLAIGLVFGFMHGFILAKMGLLTFA